MLFNTWDFVIFFVAVYLAYLRLGHRWQNRLLLAASYFFYGYWDVRFLSLIIFSTLVDFTLAKAIDASDSPRRRKALVVLSASVNLGLLAVFKYFDFFVGSAQSVMAGLGFAPEQTWTLGIILPMGISFYTFQTMSYTIDVYRRDLKPSRDLLDFTLYVSFFPQLVAGPIERGSRFLPQVCRRRVLTPEGLGKGVWYILLGYFLKVYMADNLAPMVDGIFQAEQVGGAEVLLGVYGFAFQIYGDFAGYSFIACGLAKLMGFDLMENFRRPYWSAGPGEFWHRWHISLSTWLRDYLYIPLGGNRRGPSRTYVNLLLVMVLGGLWHGAAWKYLLWGGYQGLLLVAFRGLGARGHGPESAWSWGRALRVLGFFHLACFGWLIFRCESLEQIWGWPVRIFTAWSWDETVTARAMAMAVLIVPVVLLDVLAERARSSVFVLSWPSRRRWALYAALVLMLAVLGARQAEQFIYFQF